MEEEPKVKVKVKGVVFVWLWHVLNFERTKENNQLSKRGFLGEQIRLTQNANFRNVSYNQHIYPF